MCTPAVTFTDENSESESDSDDRFKGEAWNPFPALAVESPPLPPAHIVPTSPVGLLWKGHRQAG